VATFEGLAGMQTLSVPSGAYVKLSPDQLARAARYGIQRNHSTITRLYRQGERAADFYIVLEGTVQTFWSDAIDGDEHFISLEPGEFSGELNLLNQRETLIAARALEGSSVLRIARESVSGSSSSRSLISANLSSEPLDNDGNGSCRSEPEASR
jgi:thioredoxin reductase (NADPH)